MIAPPRPQIALAWIPSASECCSWCHIIAKEEHDTAKQFINQAANIHPSLTQYW